MGAVGDVVKLRWNLSAVQERSAAILHPTIAVFECEVQDGPGIAHRNRTKSQTCPGYR
jgi:hypothetical protein